MRGISERPRGLAYVPDVVTAPEAERLLRRLAEDSYGEVRMRGQVARRTVRHYGVSYDFEAAEIAAGDPIPEWLSDVRRRCAELLDIADERLAECLLTRYPPGATIGWHRDAPMLGDVVGVSLGLPACCGSSAARVTSAASSSRSSSLDRPMYWPSPAATHGSTAFLLSPKSVTRSRSARSVGVLSPGPEDADTVGRPRGPEHRSLSEGRHDTCAHGSR